MAAKKKPAVKIGAASVEDAGIYFAVARADEASFTEWEIEPQVWQWPRSKKGERYSRRIIEEMIRDWFGTIPETTKLSAIGVSMFGLVRAGEGTVSGVSRSDWGGKTENTGLNFKALFPAERWGDIRVAVGHDATTAALGEYQALRFRLDNDEARPFGFAHVRAGAGVGVGMLGGVGSERGVPMFGRVPAEAGHIAVEPHKDDTFKEFTCTPHQKHPCLEGRISEKALLLRCKVGSLKYIADDDAVWEIVADYLSQLCVVITDVICPDVIVLGGRTMLGRNGEPRRKLFTRIREIFADRVGGYPHHELMVDLDSYIREPLIREGYASLVGVIEIARQRVFEG